MVLWNRNAAAQQDRVTPVVSTKEAVRTFFWQALLALLTASVAYLSPYVLKHLSHLYLRWALGLFCWALPALFSGKALNIFVGWQNTRQPAREQQKLLNTQRPLYGLPPPVPREEPLRQRRPFVPTPDRPAAATTSISPPQRYQLRSTPTTPIAAFQPSSAAMGTAAGVGVGRTPQSESIRTSPKPSYSPGTVVASPKQLQHYMDSLHREAPSPHGTQGQGSGYNGYSHFNYPVGGEPDSTIGAVLPVGVEPPKYRMTWLPKKSVVATPDTALSATPPEEVEDFVVTVLRARQEWLELWTENLREWLAGRVLRPLVDAVRSAHEPVNQSYNLPTRLPPLPDVFGTGLSSVSGNIDSQVEQLQKSIYGQTTQPGFNVNTPQGQDLSTLAMAVQRYQDLATLLRGKRPADLLPAANPAYVWSRIQQLSQTSCVMDFNWNGGGPWAGRPWSPDMPTDSALILYLFAAFLAAPGWDFSIRLDGAGRGVPLLLGQISSAQGAAQDKPASAILAYRPDRVGKDLDAILGLHAAPGQPLFCFLAQGRLLVLASYQFVAVFHAILFFLQYHKVRYGGAVGSHLLDDEALGLAKVIQPPPAGALVALGHKVFGWWFPPSGQKQQ